MHNLQPRSQDLFPGLGVAPHPQAREKVLGTRFHNLLFCAHTVCMNYVTNTFLLVSSSVRSKQLLCFVHCQGQKREQKHTTKNFVEFHNQSPLLTMVLVDVNHLRLLADLPEKRDSLKPCSGPLVKIIILLSLCTARSLNTLALNIP